MPLERCDVLVVGGGPAGSSCARELVHHGFDVMVADGAAFPRDKVCAGWITPQVLLELEIDAAEYRRGRTFQPITGFLVGVIGRRRTVEACYTSPVSYAIRRCEFDHYLLARSGARLRLGTRIRSIVRDGEGWLVDGAIRASVLVGAGGHFCPIARLLNGGGPRAPLVAAQEIELARDAQSGGAFRVAPERPELYFSPDLQGYGWCVGKGAYLNVGFGQIVAQGGPPLPRAAAGFVDFLQSRGTVTGPIRWSWKGHAYHLAAPIRRKAVDEGVVLVGDAAGLAHAQSGEGIRPAVESGLLAARALAEANGVYSRQRLAPYDRALRERFSPSAAGIVLARLVPSAIASALGRELIGLPWFARRLVIDRWFLHAHQPSLPPSRRRARNQ